MIQDFAGELLDGKQGQLMQQVWDFAKVQLRQRNRGRNTVPSSPTWQYGKFYFHCTFTRGTAPRYPQFTLLAEQPR
jgi:hypothetical protein